MTPAEERRMRPTHVYRLYDADGRLIYVGQSQLMGLRMRTHRMYSWWYRLIDSIDLELHPNREAGLAAEALAIQEEQPAFNIAGTGREFGDFSHWTDEDQRICREWLRSGANRSGMPTVVIDFLSGYLAERLARIAAYEARKAAKAAARAAA